MNAKLVTIKDQHELVFGTGKKATSFISQKGESLENFIQRISTQEVMDEITVNQEVTVETYKSLDNEQLAAKVKLANGTLEPIILDGIAKARKNPSFSAEDSEPDAPEAKTLTARVPRPPLTPEETAECAANKGKLITFKAFAGLDELTVGTINGLMHDKRVSKTYYRIMVGPAKIIYHKEVNSSDIVSIAENPELEEQEKAKIEAIEAALQARADAKAAKIAAVEAKVALKKVALEEAAKAKAERIQLKITEATLKAEAAQEAAKAKAEAAAEAAKAKAAAAAEAAALKAAAAAEALAAKVKAAEEAAKAKAEALAAKVEALTPKA